MEQIDGIYFYPLDFDIIVMQIGYLYRIFSDNSLRMIYDDINKIYDCKTSILYIDSSSTKISEADNPNVAEIRWNCDLVDDKFCEHPISKKIYNLLKDKVGNQLDISDCIVFFIDHKEEGFCDSNNMCRLLEDNISSCNHCALFPCLDEEAFFTIKDDEKEYSVKYYSHDTESG